MINWQVALPVMIIFGIILFLGWIAARSAVGIGIFTQKNGNNDQTTKDEKRHEAVMNWLGILLIGFGALFVLTSMNIQFNEFGDKNQKKQDNATAIENSVEHTTEQK